MWMMILLFIGGFLSGIINVLAGGGSFLTLPLLSLYGLSPSVANATNRIAILLQNISATGNFLKNRMLQPKNALFLGIPTIIGGIVGSLIVLKLPENFIKLSLGVIFLVMAYFVIFSPKVWEEGKREVKRKKTVSFLVFFLIGLYGGYIQAGVGFFLIYALTILEGYNLKNANAMKILLTLLFTVFALAIFSVGKKIEFVPGIVMGLGSFVGGYFGSHLNMKVNIKIIRIILAAMMVISALSYLI
ncbi:MAG: sulfite exporter TauE/SafE family protein [Fervidobacterium sp.]|nr:sulfite exporter TauE/SafE family protein [Fervidobacterium sp.]